MIRYALKCADDHSFESWFQSAEAFDRLSSAGMISCAVCGSDRVSKSLMAPAVAADRPTAIAKSGSPGPLAAPASPEEKALAEIRAHIEKNSDYVGLNFAAEARSMHLGDTPLRQIHGEAKPEDARQLIEDGVPVAPLPFLPARKAN